MSKAIVLGLALLVASAMVQAQEQSPQSSPQSTAPSSSGQTSPESTQQATPAPDQTAPTQQPTDNGNGNMQSTPQQSPDTTGPMSNSTGNNQASAKPTATTGCVRISVDHVVLTDDSGKMYNLAGDTSNLNSDVGHKIQVMGVVDNTGSVSTNTTTPQGSTESQRPTITVQQVQPVSGSCK